MWGVIVMGDFCVGCGKWRKRRGGGGGFVSKNTVECPDSKAGSSIGI